MNVKSLDNISANRLSGSAFLTGVSYGLFGILVDVDHILKTYIWTDLSSRFLHPYFALLGGIILCFVVSCYARLLVRNILK